MDLKETGKKLKPFAFGSSGVILCSRHPEWISATGLCSAGAVRNCEG